MAEGDPRSAIVLFSGGQDSTACLAWALTRFARVETVGFDYGQRHRIELDCRVVVRDALCAAFPHWAARLGGDHLLDVGLLGRISDTALTTERDIALSNCRPAAPKTVAGPLGGQARYAATGGEHTQADGLPNTFVPGRNLLFLTLAAAIAYRRGVGVLVGGMCETDYSGYPDCRDNTLKAMQVALSLGLDTAMTVETPLMFLTKADTWALTQRLGGAALTDIVIEHTHTCYLGERGSRHAWGHGCGHCPACSLRRAGYEAWRSGGTDGVDP